MMSPMLDKGITEATLIHLRSESDEIAAVALDCRIAALETLYKRTYLERGIILFEVEQRLLWQKINDPATGVPFTSLDRWILTRCPQSRSDAYAALRAVKELRDIPRERLEAIPRCNMAILQALSSKVRESPKVLDAAKLLSQREFVVMLEKDYPEMHIEQRRTIHLHPVASASPIIEQGFRVVMQHEGLTTREQVLEFWATKSIQEYQEAEAV